MAQLQPVLTIVIACLIVIVLYLTTSSSPTIHCAPCHPCHQSSSSPSNTNNNNSTTTTTALTAGEPEWSIKLSTELIMLREEMLRWRQQALTITPPASSSAATPAAAVQVISPVCPRYTPSSTSSSLSSLLTPMDTSLAIGHQWSAGPFVINEQSRSSILVAILTLNHWNEVERLLHSMMANDDHETYDVILLDDGSFDDTVKNARTYGLTVLSNEGVDESVGVTAKWNEAYRYFLKHQYKKLFLLNNDILIPNGVIPKLSILLDTYAMAVPMSSRLGVGHVRSQAIELVYPDTVVAFVHTAANFRTIQRWLDTKHSSAATHIPLTEFNGFFFGVSRAIERAAFSKESLFNPATINIGNEPDLTNRMRSVVPPIDVALCTSCYSYHYKSVTTIGTRQRHGEDRDNLDAIRNHERKIIEQQRAG